METRAYLKGTRLSPQKAGLVANAVRGKAVQDAMDFLTFSKQKAASVIGVPDMVLEGLDIGLASLKVTDKKNATANDYAVQVIVNNDDGKNLPYKFWFKVENLKLLPGKYDVKVSSKNISHFVNTNVGIQYWIALEPESKYDA